MWALKKSIFPIVAWTLGFSLVGFWPSIGISAESRFEELANAARRVLEKNCFECHGANSKKISADLNVLQISNLMNEERKLVVAGKPDESELVRRSLTDDQDERMPPLPKTRLSEGDRKTLRDWVAAGAPAFANANNDRPHTDSSVAELPARVKEVFRTHCFDCHGGIETKAGVKILDWDRLVAKKRKAIPGKPEASSIYRLITAQDQTVMPPAGNPRLSDADIALIRDWIAAGAAKFPDDITTSDVSETIKDYGPNYVLERILTDIRKLNVEDRKFVRYFSTNHLLGAGVSRAELNIQREALAKAINHLSRKRKIAVPRVVDAPAETIFAVDIRNLGWEKQPLFRIQNNQTTTASPINVYDLALLEYPYAVIDEESKTYAMLLEEYLGAGKFIRPIPYLRVDWFVSVVTQSPLYEDFLQLPFDLKELEKQLGVDSEANLRNGQAKRAGMTVSGVSRNNRIVERHESPDGAYWKSIDTATSKGRENMFRDPAHVEGSGGEIIFNLPNGLQGYYLALSNGRRIEAAPTAIVTDKFAEDKTVRNGMACIRCHDQGMKDFVDNVRPVVEKLPSSPGFNKQEVLALYAPQDEMDKLVDEDRNRFLHSMETVLGKPQTSEPIAPVANRYLNQPLSLGIVAGEVGANRKDELAILFRSPKLVSLGLAGLSSPGGVARRDMWEDSFHQVMKDLGMGLPVVALDGLTRLDFPPNEPPFEVKLATNRPGNAFAPGDDLVITVTNTSQQDLHIELLGTSEKGEKVVLVTANTILKAGKQFRFPEVGSIKVRGGVGKEQVTLFACDREFPAGEVLRGQGTTDRFVHKFYKMSVDRGQPKLDFDPTRMVKRTIEIETK